MAAPKYKMTQNDPHPDVTERLNELEECLSELKERLSKLETAQSEKDKSIGLSMAVMYETLTRAAKASSGKDRL